MKLPLEDYDALLVVCEGLGDLVVFRNSDCPAVCVCLTPLRFVFDESYRQRWLEGKGAFGKMALALASGLFRFFDRRAWRHYARVFCISNEAKRRAVSGRLATDGELDVLHVGLGFDPREPGDTFQPYFLIPGRIMWTKNVELGIEAFRIFRDLRPEFAGFRLVIAGMVDEKSKSYLTKLRELAGDDPAIEFREFPSDEQFAELYAECYTVLFTAFNEDWGIVPLEGMAFGKPAVAVNRGGPVESILDGVNGFLVEPEPAAFASKMAVLAFDLAVTRRMGRAGNEHCRRYSWSRFTNCVDEELEQAVKVQRDTRLGKVSEGMLGSAGSR